MERLNTQNEAYGFYGTIRHYARPSLAWPVAMELVCRATGMEACEVRAFLDSTWGRHFADSVSDGLVAGRTIRESVLQAVQVWMGWPLNARTRARLGIQEAPLGTPYLMAMVYAASQFECEDAA